MLGTLNKEVNFNDTHGLHHEGNTNYLRISTKQTLVMRVHKCLIIIIPFPLPNNHIMYLSMWCGLHHAMLILSAKSKETTRLEPLIKRSKEGVNTAQIKSWSSRPWYNVLTESFNNNDPLSDQTMAWPLPFHRTLVRGVIRRKQWDKSVILDISINPI